MSIVSDVIKVFENDEYSAMFYHLIKDIKTDGFVASKFKIKLSNGKKRYALILALPVESGGKEFDIEIEE